MITDNPLFRRMMTTGEEQLGRFTTQLLGNEKFLSTVQTAVTKALGAKGLLDQQVAGALQAMHVPTTQDMRKLNDRLDELERIFEGLVTRVDAIADKLEASQREQ